jgi:hypothetical protein
MSIIGERVVVLGSTVLDYVDAEQLATRQTPPTGGGEEE